MLNNSSGISASVIWSHDSPTACPPVNWPVARPILFGQQDGQSNADIKQCAETAEITCSEGSTSAPGLPPQKTRQLDCAALVEQ